MSCKPTDSSKTPKQFDLFRDKSSQIGAEPLGSSLEDAQHQACRSTRTSFAPSQNFYSVKEVASRYGVSVPTIWRWAATREGFPSSVKLSKGTTRWRRVDLERFDRSVCVDEGEA